MLEVTFAVAPSGNIHLHLIPDFSGADDASGEQFADGTAAVAISNTRVGTFTLRAVTTPQFVPLQEIKIPKHRYKVQLYSEAGQTPSGGTLNEYPIARELL